LKFSSKKHHSIHNHVP